VVREQVHYEVLLLLDELLSPDLDLLLRLLVDLALDLDLLLLLLLDFDRDEEEEVSHAILIRHKK
jgi:hypothetical protein